MECLSKMLCHHTPPEQLQYALASILQVSGTILKRWNTMLPEKKKIPPPFCVLMVVVESAVWHVSSKSPLGVQLDWDLMTAEAIAYDLHHFHACQIVQWAAVPCGFPRHNRASRPPSLSGSSIQTHSILLVDATHAVAHLSKIWRRMTHLTTSLFFIFLYTSANGIASLNLSAFDFVK